MLFNSLEYIFFLPAVFFFYWFLTNRNARLQNLLLLAAGYVFYGWWDWRFLALKIFSSMTDYTIGVGLQHTEDSRKRKILLGTSLALNLGFLGFFKYFNFFVESMAAALGQIGLSVHLPTLNLILPLGISFYTFQSLGYIIDVYKKKVAATQDVVVFFIFSGFFPQLIAGPIERAQNLLPQLTSPREFDYHLAADGMRQILWGLYKKVVVADTCLKTVDHVFRNYESLSGPCLWIGIFLFTFQIYCDFSGYSDIAIGTAKLLGIRLMKNFDYPYFSRDIVEFWRRWHISLSTWFRDYVYIPLGGGRGSRLQRIRNVIITFSVSGLWHGAAWTFIFWGFLNSLYYIPVTLRDRKKRSDSNVNAWFSNSIQACFNILITFWLTMTAWIFFRADSISQAWGYLKGMYTHAMRYPLPELTEYSEDLTIAFLAIAVLVAVEWLQRRKEHGLVFESTPLLLRWSAYFLIGFAVISYFGEKTSFIYLQF